MAKLGHEPTNPNISPENNPVQKFDQGLGRPTQDETPVSLSSLADFLSGVGKEVASRTTSPVVSSASNIAEEALKAAPAVSNIAQAAQAAPATPAATMEQATPTITSESQQLHDLVSKARRNAKTGKTSLRAKDLQAQDEWLDKQIAREEARRKRSLAQQDAWLEEEIARENTPAQRWRREEDQRWKEKQARQAAKTERKRQRSLAEQDKQLEREIEAEAAENARKAAEQQRLLARQEAILKQEVGQKKARAAREEAAVARAEARAKERIAERIAEETDRFGKRQQAEYEEQSQRNAARRFAAMLAEEARAQEEARNAREEADAKERIAERIAGETLRSSELRQSEYEEQSQRNAARRLAAILEEEARTASHANDTDTGVAFGPGFVDIIGYDYTADSKKGKDDKRKDAERIEAGIAANAQESDLSMMYPDAVGFGGYTGDEIDATISGESLRTNDPRYIKNQTLVERFQSHMRRILDWYHRAYIPLESETIDKDGRIRFKGTNPSQFDEDAEIGSDTERAIAEFMGFMGFDQSEKHLVFQMAIKELGLSPDRKGLFFSKSARETIPDFMFIQALNNIMISCRTDYIDAERRIECRNPYGFVNRSMYLGNTRCYPVGVMTRYEAEVLCRPGHIFAGEDPYELMSRTANVWRNDTLPALRRNVFRQENGEAQMLVIEDMVRALCSLDGASARLYGISEDWSRSYDVVLTEAGMSRPGDTEDDRAAAELRVEQLERMRRRQERSAARLDRKRNRTFEVYTRNVADENGEIIHREGELSPGYTSIFGHIVRKPFASDDYDKADIGIQKVVKQENVISAYCMSAANLMRFAGVVAYVPLIVSAEFEHAQGNLNSKFSNWLLFGGLNGRANEDYKPTEAMYAMIERPESLEALAAQTALYQVGGMDALIAFYQSEYNPDGQRVLNLDSVKKFLDEFVRKEKPKLMPQKAQELQQKLDKWTQTLLPGNLGFKKADARRWLEGFMLNNMWNNGADRSMLWMMDEDSPLGERLTGDANRHEFGFTASEVFGLMQSMGMERFLAATTQMNAGRDAMIMARNQTFDRINPLSHTIDKILRANGVTNLAVSLAIDKYFTYGLNLVQLMIPFSNTFSYLTVKGMNRIFTGGRNNQDRDNLSILDYQMGGNDSFLIGLRKNMMYDSVKLANIGLMACFFAIMFEAFGFDEPEDPDNKYVWSEYRIGRNFNWGGYDAEGNPTGISIYFAWWLNDFTMSALPGAYAICAKRLDQKLGENDPDLPVKLFRSGCYDMLSGSSLLDTIKFVNNVDRDLKTYREAMENPDIKEKPGWVSAALFEMELFCWRGLGNFVPNALKSMRTDTVFVGENELDRDAYKVYDRSSETPGATKPVDNYYEQMRRVESKYNPLYALWNNLTKNHYPIWRPFDRGDTDKTGYFFGEMPIKTTPGVMSAYYAERYGYDPDNIPGGEENRIPYTEEKVELLLEDINNFNSVEEAVNNGFYIPPALREQAIYYCWAQYNAAENRYNSQEFGKDYDAQHAAYKKMRDEKNYYYNLITQWLRNRDIPWSSKDYAVLLSDYYQVYYYKRSGAPATRKDYRELGDSEIGVKYVAKGNHPTSIWPITTPELQNTGYNYETLPYWLNTGESGTDIDALQQALTEDNILLPWGYHKDVPVADALYGGRSLPVYGADELGDDYIYSAPAESYRASLPTEGRRALTPYDETLLYGLRNVDTSADAVAQGVASDYGNGVNSTTSSTPGAGTTTGSGAPSSGTTGAGSGDVTVNVGGTPTNMTNEEAFFDYLDSISRENIGPNSSLGELGMYYDKSHWEQDSTPNWENQTWPVNGVRRYASAPSNPKIYSNSRNVNADKASTMYSKAPRDAKTTYLNPSFETKGSREAYKRQDL